ncbi:HEAT repeat domain-containing protein [uncultured Apibacter sp.]|uniref:HEAT repeat domain-containing protein n=1 Tax=uncultured Apibacter sp. TaxID=1778616 RepID=UPI0025FE0D2C|nr:HEAT repeat domain-containing protein [uncultured Apibacter sp.]
MKEQILEVKSLIDKMLINKEDFIPFEVTHKISNLLISSNDKEMLEFHYSLLKIKDDAVLYYEIRTTFEERPKEIIEPFLLDKLKTEQDISLKGDIIQLLGGIGSFEILPYVKSNIKSEIRDIRYRCIIVLGWIGTKEDLPILNERLINESDDELRGYAATAMRSLWSDNKLSKEDILPYLYSALVNENSEETLSSIIITIQDLLKRKFGLQERIDEGIITGDVFKAKEKVIQKLGLK